MLFSKPLTFLVLPLLISIFAIAWVMHHPLAPSWDTIWLMEAAKRMLHGGTYTHDFFETNPPLIFFLYLPPIFISSLLHLDIMTSFRGYIFFLSAASLLLCYPWAKRIFSKQNPWMLPLILMALSICYLILPLYELGQRDHLLVILTMPYLFITAYRLENGSVNPLAALMLGLLAGIGFSLKPHFLITPLLIELYCMLKQKNIFYWWRPEVLALGCFMGCYLMAVVIFFPDYFSFIIPFSLRHYYAVIGSSLSSLLLPPLALFCWLPFILFFLTRPQLKTYKYLSVIFLLALTGFLFSYISQRNTFYYHFIPPLSLAILLFTLLFTPFLLQHRNNKIAFIFILLTAISFFILPILQWHQIYQRWAGHKARVKNLIHFLQTEAPHQPVYFLTTTMVYSFPSMYYAKAKHSSRFPFLWMVASLANQENKNSALFLKDKMLLIHMICEDFQKNKPALVFIDESQHKPYFSKSHFDFLNYFSQDPAFKTEWKNYQYLTTIKQYGVYQLGVYKRIV